MTRPIRIVHTADFHLGVDTLGPIDQATRINGRVLDYLDALDAMIEYAEQNGADLVLFAGDIFHKRDPDPTYIRLFGERLVRLSKSCQVVMIPGNHDLPGIEEKAGAVDLFDTLQLSNIMVARIPQVLYMTTKAGDIQIACMPYPMRQRYLLANEARSDNAKELLRQKVSATIKQLNSLITDDTPAIFLGHFSVSGAVFGSERLMVMGIEAEVMLEDLLQPCYNYVALGHLHYYQNIGLVDLPVIYPGSLERVDFTEEKHQKGFVWIELEKSKADYKFVEVDARLYKTIEIDVIGKRRPTDKILEAIAEVDIKQAVVRIIIHVDEGAALNMDAITKLLADMEVYCIHSINIKRDRGISETRLSDKPVATMTQVELLDEYWKSQDKFSKVEHKELLSLAVDIMEDTEYGENAN